MLTVENLAVHFPSRRGTVKAVNDVSFSLDAGEILGLVGESGCGKSMTLLSLMGLVPYPGQIAGGKINFQGQNLLELSNSDLRRIRGRQIAMIFQDPLTTLNPVFKVGEQVAEALRVHQILEPEKKGLFSRSSSGAIKEEVLKLMQDVGIPAPEQRFDEYPHQFSGGMQQRAIIAIALSCRPQLLLADEPTTALDVTVQAQIMDLLRQINQREGTGIILVTHNLALAAEFCRRLAVMYAGELMELGPAEAVITEPLHPYTKGLLRSLPYLVPKGSPLTPIPGNVPDLAQLPAGCPFSPRCDVADHVCLEKEPPWVETVPDHAARCWRLT
ncbi:MAG TPA: ABC transporter ATP-binding protein [Firmicutes bacterium]|nr:ABC transporter ATP-binding protein [Bacillota bacterium]